MNQLKAFASRYRPSYLRALVFMLQENDYRLWPFLDWFTRTTDFRTIEHRRASMSVRSRLLLIGLWLWVLWSILSIGYTFVITARAEQPALAVYWLFLLVSMPFGLAYTVAMPFAIERIIRHRLNPLTAGRIFLRGLVAQQLEMRVKRLLRRSDIQVVAVTGSVGKTSTKLAIGEVLRQKYRVLAQEGNYNSQVSVPMTFFELEVPASLTNPLAWFRIWRQIDHKLRHPYPHEVVVVEMGADRPGDIPDFMRYIHPTIGVVTAIAPAHMEQFGSIENIAKEKMSLAKGSQVALLNYDDERVRGEGAKLNKKVETYGVHHGHVHFVSTHRSDDGTLGGELCLRNHTVKLQTRFLGEHSLQAVCAAAAVALDLGLSPDEIIRGVESLGPFAGRMNPLEGKKGSRIIDDTYNASPESGAAGLQALYELPGSRKIAIMGSMNELGDYAAEGHKLVGKQASKLDLLLTIGSNANQHLAGAAEKAGLAKSKIHRFDSPYAAGRYLAPLLKKGDLVLAKGSQNGVFAEEAVGLLLADHSHRSRLVRQGEEWQIRKQRQFAAEAEIL